MITPDLSPQARINILKGADSHVLWQVFRDGVKMLEDEQQELVNDLRRTGEQHECDRLTRYFYECLARGDTIQLIINRLESQIKVEEVKPDPA